MAANKFATMLHRNTHKLTVILVYAVLEWFLIFLLLLNSLLFFLISKFANYFGLEPPCLLCSRIDQTLEPNSRNNAYTNLICESHATEISQLGFCPRHKKLAESQKLCKNCIPKKPKTFENSVEISRRIGLFTWVNEKRIENCVTNLKCSCCNGILSRKFHPYFLVFRPSWGTSGHSWRRDLTAKVIHEESNEGEVSETSDCDCFLDQGGNDVEAKEDDDANIIQACQGEDDGAISLIDSSTMVQEAASHLATEVSEERVNGNLKQPGGEEEDYNQTLFGDDETKPATVTGKEFKALTGPGPEMSETSSIDQGLQKIQRDCQSINQHLSKVSDISRAEDSWDGSFISEMESSDGILTVEKLKSVLQAERNALTALYTELEEERSAAAIATSQTMAMITRLQEEKAAMQMEALQYQRMMEEQSEYDQEALQLLNELMLKREKEKQELEREVELYRKRVSDYEAKEKTVMIRRDSNSEDTDEQSIDLNHETNDKTSTDGFLNFEEMGKDLSSLDDSLTAFEEERISILEELKSLEEKLFTLANNNNEELFFDNFGDGCPIENGYFGNSNGEDISEHNEMDSKGKNLLPLFDATAIVNGDRELDEEGVEENLVDSKLELVNKKVGIEEEVDHVYERLQALETDREFLKHCVGSLKKGDKGIDLLQEILELLRDLRTVELRARSGCNSPLS